MQTIEKALHQPMPFTTGGQTITDRLTAAKHSLAGSQLGKTICKATTEELMAPKKKHLDYLLHCTQEPNVSIPSMANLLIERTQNPNWTVVYKALITIHNIMCYGNERFSQYLASCNTTFNLGSFLDKNSAQDRFYMERAYQSSTRWASLDSSLIGYDMSQHVRRYGKYISEKIYTYRLCAYDFCKVKRGREDGLLRTMNTDKLLKTLPILQNQIDALLEFQVTSAELNNGVINCSFILLFRDLIRLFACYNDGIINLLEKFFDMNKKQCREALDAYKSFLLRLDKVASFLKVAETVGIDRSEIPDLTRAPASLLEALESHLAHLEGGKVQPSMNHEQFTAAMAQSTPLFSATQTGIIDDSAKQKYLEEEKERLRLFEEQRKRQAAGSTVSDSAVGSFNPFAPLNAQPLNARPSSTKPSDDLLSLFDPMPAAAAAGGGGVNVPPTYAAAVPAMPMQQPVALDPTNPFAQSVFQQPVGATSSTSAYFAYPAMSSATAFGADFSNAFGNTSVVTTAPQEMNAPMNPFLMGGGAPEATEQSQSQWTSGEEESVGEQWAPKSAPSTEPQWAPVTQAELEGGAVAENWTKGTDDSSESGDETGATNTGQPSEAVGSVMHNPFGTVQQSAQADASPVHFGVTAPVSQLMIQRQNLGIYDQTPFSRTDGSYTSSPVMPHHMQGQLINPAMQTAPGGTANLSGYSGQPPTTTSSSVSQSGKFSGNDLDSALSSLADNLSVSGKGNTSQGKPVQWNNQGVRPTGSVGAAHPLGQIPQYGAMPTQAWPPMGAVYPAQTAMYMQQPMMGMYGQPGYNPQAQQSPAFNVAAAQPQQQPQQSPAQRPFM